ncbi:MAG: ABC transporter permease, partial [Planctomycetota bacterium]
MSLRIAKIQADTTARAPRASLRSRQFRRMLDLARPHWRRIAVGMVAAVFMALFHSVSIGGVVPVLKVLFSEEGIHGAADRTVAEDRLGARLGIGTPSDAGADRRPGVRPVVIHALKDNWPLLLAGLGELDLIASLDGETLDGPEILRRIAQAPPDLTVRLGVKSQDEAPTQPSERSLTLPTLKWRWRALLWTASLIPRDLDRMVTLAYIVSAICVTVLLTNVFRFLAQYFIAYGVLRATMDLRRQLYAKVLKLPMSFFTRDTSDIVSRFVQDVQEIQRGLNSFFGKMFREPLKGGFILVLALIHDWQTTLVVVVIGPWVGLIFWRIGKSIRKANRRLLRGYGRMIDALETTLSAITVVKAASTENLERKRLWEIDRRMFQHQLRIVRLEAVLTPLLELLGVVGLSLVTVWLGSRVVGGDLNPEEFIGSVFIMGMLLDPIRRVADVYPRLMRSAAGAERIFPVLDLPPEQD